MVLSANGTIWRNWGFLIVHFSGGSAWAIGFDPHGKRRIEIERQRQHQPSGSPPRAYG